MERASSGDAGSGRVVLSIVDLHSRLSVGAASASGKEGAWGRTTREGGQAFATRACALEFACASSVVASHALEV